jgi:hypothetical protein
MSENLQAELCPNGKRCYTFCLQLFLIFTLTLENNFRYFLMKRVLSRRARMFRTRNIKINESMGSYLVHIAVIVKKTLAEKLASVKHQQYLL